MADAADTYFGSNPWQQVTSPIRFLHAQWSVGFDSAPGYPPELVDQYRAHTIQTRLLSQLDHAGTIMTHRGAAAVAQMIKDAIREPARWGQPS